LMVEMRSEARWWVVAIYVTKLPTQQIQHRIAHGFFCSRASSTDSNQKPACARNIGLSY
jgi:hypothetical protein